jgi:CheY-like chemotaxis protein
MNVVPATRVTFLLAILMASACASDMSPPLRGQVLWVDDHPAGNREETAALHELGLQVVTASSNAQAAELFRAHRYVLIISDIRRGGTEPATAGLALPAELRRIRTDLPPVIYYVGRAEKAFTDEGQPVTSNSPELLRFVESRLPKP